MPIVLFSIDGTNNSGPAFQRATADITALGSATVRTTAQTAAFEAALRAANTMTDQFAGRLTAAESAIGRTTAALAAQNAALDAANRMFGTAAGAIDTWAAGQGRAVAAVDATTAALTRQAAAYDRMTAAQRASTIGSVDRAVVSDAGSAFSNRLGTAGRIVAGGAAADVGLLGRAGNALLGPEGLAALGLGYGGFKAAQASTRFQSAEAQTGAQIGNPAAAAAAAQAILAYTAGGKLPYDPTILMQSIEPLLAHGYSAQAIRQGLPSVAQLSAQNKAPDLTTSDNAINTYLSLTGTGPRSTGAQITAAADFVSKMEQLTTIPPGQLSSALPRLLAGTVGTGVTPDEAGAMLLKVGTANPSARLDSTGLVRLFSDLLVKPSAGAVKTADSLGLSIGSGALSAYGGSTNAMIAAYATATAGPNQTKLLSQLLPQTNAVQAFQELRLGGGSQQTMGYQARLANSSGSAAAAYAAYSVGIQQQETQLANQFNSDLVQLGGTINQYVIPALLGMAKGALGGAGDVAQGITASKSWLDQHIPGGTGTVLAAASMPFTGPLAVTGSLMKGFYDHTTGVQQAIGHAMGQVGNVIDMPMRATAAIAASNASNHFVRHLGSLKGGTGDQGVLDTGAGNDFVRHLGSLKGGTGDQGFGAQLPAVVRALTSLGPLADSLAGGFGMLNTAATTAATGLRNSLGPPTNAPLNADRSTLQMMIGGGATTPRLYTELATLKSDLLNSTYNSAQQHAIYQQASQKVYAAAVGPGDQARVDTAQTALSFAQQMNEPLAKQKAIFDDYISAQRQLARDTEHGPALQKTLNSINQQGQLYSYKNNLAGINQTVHDYNNRISIDQLSGNTADLSQTQKALLAYETAHAGQLGLRPSDLALQAAQNHAGLMAMNPVTNLHPFYQKNAGLGSFEAGEGSTLVRSGGVDPATQEMRLMRQEISALRATNEDLLRQIANNTKTSQAKNSATNPHYAGFH